MLCENESALIDDCAPSLSGNYDNTVASSSVGERRPMEHVSMATPSQIYGAHGLIEGENQPSSVQNGTSSADVNRNDSGNGQSSVNSFSGQHSSSGNGIFADPDDDGPVSDAIFGFTRQSSQVVDGLLHAATRIEVEEGAALAALGVGSDARNMLNGDIDVDSGNDIVGENENERDEGLGDRQIGPAIDMMMLMDVNGQPLNGLPQQTPVSSVGLPLAQIQPPAASNRLHSQFRQDLPASDLRAALIGGEANLASEHASTRSWRMGEYSPMDDCNDDMMLQHDHVHSDDEDHQVGTVFGLSGEAAAIGSVGAGVVLDGEEDDEAHHHWMDDTAVGIVGEDSDDEDGMMLMVDGEDGEEDGILVDDSSLEICDTEGRRHRSHSLDTAEASVSGGTSAFERAGSSLSALLGSGALVPRSSDSQSHSRTGTNASSGQDRSFMQGGMLCSAAGPNNGASAPQADDSTGGNVDAVRVVLLGMSERGQASVGIDLGLACAAGCDGAHGGSCSRERDDRNPGANAHLCTRCRASLAGANHTTAHRLPSLPNSEQETQPEPPSRPFTFAAPGTSFPTNHTPSSDQQSPGHTQFSFSGMSQLEGLQTMLFQGRPSTAVRRKGQARASKFSSTPAVRKASLDGAFIMQTILNLPGVDADRAEIKELALEIGTGANFGTAAAITHEQASS